MNHPTERISHATDFVTHVVKHWYDREIAKWFHHKGSISGLNAFIRQCTMELFSV